MIDKPCPWCNEVHPARVTRTDTGCAEWQCSGCGKRWTVKAGDPNHAYPFFPGDIDAAESDAIEPLITQ